MAGSALSALGGNLIGGAVKSLFGGSAQKNENNAVNAASPFNSQYAQYQPMLQQLVSNPSSVTSTPQYQFQMQQGTQAINQGEAAEGQLNSGNRATALETYGQGLASSSYQQQFQDLAQLSGVGAGSMGAASSVYSDQANQQNAGLGAIASQVGNLASGGLSDFFGGNGSVMGSDFFPAF